MLYFTRYGWIPGDNEVSNEMRKRFQWVNNTYGLTALVFTSRNHEETP
jgi:hypothetical protein